MSEEGVPGVLNKIVKQGRALVRIAEFLGKPLVIVEERQGQARVRANIALSDDPERVDKVLSYLKEMYPDADITTIAEMDAREDEGDPPEGN